MGASIPCPWCRLLNEAGRQTCILCREPLFPAGAHRPGVRPGSIWDEDAATTATRVGVTMAGLALAVVGLSLSWIPWILGPALLGSGCIVAGAALIVYGSRAFGPEHAGNAIPSAFLLVVGFLGALALPLSVGNILANPARPWEDSPAGILGSLRAAFDILFVGGLVVEIATAFGLRHLTLALQGPVGRRLLDVALVIGIAIPAFMALIFVPMIHSRDLSFFQVGLVDFLASVQNISALAAVPAGLNGAACIMALRRILIREIPSHAEASEAAHAM